MLPLTLLHRHQRGLPFVDSVVQDVRFAARLLMKDRWFTAAAAVTLALGIGANTTIFTVVNGWNLAKLPVDEPEQIVQLGTSDARGRQRGVSYLDFRDWQKSARSFSGVAGYTGSNMSVAVEGHAADRVAGTFISANGFSILRERPVLGRDFRPEDDQAGAEPVVILAHHVWTDRFGTDAAVMGRTIRVNGAPATIIGVMPSGFRFPMLADIWLPLANVPGIATQPRDDRSIGVFGRLADDVTVAQARAELSTIVAALAEQFPATNQGLAATVVRFTEYYFGRLTDGPPLIMMVAVGFVLLIACANAANLLLARGASRAREISLRAALGASRGRILRLLLVESLLLAALAGVSGLLLAWPLVRAIAAETADFNLPYWARLTFDGHVFGFVAAICVGTVMLFGLAPAWKLSETRTAHMLEDGGRTVGVGLRSRRLTSGLLIAELALTVILLAGAGLLIRSALVLYEVDQLVRASDVLIAQVTMPATKYSTPQERMAFYERLEQRLVSLPSVASAALGNAPPFFGARGTRDVVLDDDAEGVLAGGRRAVTVPIGARYFETLGLSLRRGRPFGTDDGLPGHETAIVNERFAALYLTGQDPIGRRIRLTEERSPGTAPRAWLTIVGLSPSIRHSPASDAGPVVYLPLRAQPGASITLMVRGGGDSTAVAPAVREQVRMLDADLPLHNILTLERLSQLSRWTHRFGGSMLGLFAGVAMLLSALGLYAVTAYGVTQRTSEIGIRVALGATRSQITWLFLKDTLIQLGVGLTLGIAGSIVVGQLLRGLLVQTSALDPLTFMTVIVLSAVVGVIACLVPTRRASALDPAITLRHD
jgi:predicted permease